ncbi:hypothetical protein [Fructobacillus cardui]|uniref:hypothetical protein n=1 Tax=Fructobacillus cardui TaxID=2893170 RepID=UPI002DB0F3A0|nr:hypothetical protein R53653_IHELHDKM_00710 [Fructobacillus cardui]
MYNYRRVFVDEARFKHVYGKFYSPIWINGRLFGTQAVAIVLSTFLVRLFHLLEMSNFYIGVLMIIACSVSVYYLDRYLKVDHLPFERQVVAMVKYFCHYRWRSNQLYQDEHTNVASKTVRIM